MLLLHAGIILGTLWHSAEVEDGLGFTDLSPQNPDAGIDRQTERETQKEKEAAFSVLNKLLMKLSVGISVGQ